MPRRPDDDEFTEFVHVVSRKLYRTAYLLLGDRAEAEDLVQTSLAKTYASWSSVRSVDAAPAYAHTVLLNTASSWFRKRSWRNERPTEELPDTGLEPDLSVRPTLLAALETLPPRQRAVVVLRFYEDLTIARTAELLGCTEGTVKSQTFEAFAKLRELLGDAVVLEPLGGTA
jgi:RNA polymerase sigma-70 factor (sigma-E family)